MQVSLGPIELLLLGSIHANFVHEHIQKIDFDGARSCWAYLEGKTMRGVYMGDVRVDWTEIKSRQL
jgi:hypothetical protein